MFGEDVLVIFKSLGRGAACNTLTLAEALAAPPLSPVPVAMLFCAPVPVKLPGMKQCTVPLAASDTVPMPLAAVFAVMVTGAPKSSLQNMPLAVGANPAG